MLLKDLIKDIYPPNQIPPEFWDFPVESICSDSRQAKKGSLFIALKGPADDGGKFVGDAIKNGAAIIVKNDSPSSVEERGVCVLTVPDTRRFLKELLKRFYDDPSHKIKTIGITGTNGKTTITYLLESIFQSAGKGCGVIGTIDYHFGSKRFVAKNTTPGVIDSHHYLSDMIKEGMPYCAMEVSSHALDQGRVAGIDFRTAVFTNLTSDHLDYHKDREDYFLSKAILFKNLSAQAIAVINQDDPHAGRLMEMTPATVVTYGIQNPSDVIAENIDLSLKGTTFVLKTLPGHISISTRLIGLHNVYNILAAAAVGWKENVSLEKIKDGIERLASVPGRMESIDDGQDFHVFVDYAHTEDAMRNILSSVRNVSDARIILVFGCGGDRDKTKRPKMGKVASAMADFVIITSDNPRSEDPKTIIDEILLGFDGDHYQIVLNRDQAIQEAIHRAKTGDVVIIAGKGHEDQQIFKDKTIPFDERQFVKNYLKNNRTPEHQGARK